MANKIDFSVGFQTDVSGLSQAKKALQEIKQMTLQDYVKIKPDIELSQAKKEFRDLKESAAELEGVFTRTFNKDLGTVNIAKFNQEIKSLSKPLSQIQQDMSALGPKGANAFRNMATNAMTAKTQIQETKTVIDKMGESLIKSAGWFVSSSVINRLAGSVQEAYGYVKNLDSSLNDIRIVTGASADEMDKFAIRANKAAKALGSATTDYTKAALIYRQQGLGEEETDARAQTTLKVSNVTKQDAAAVSEELTALWNGYQIAAEDTESSVDKLSAVAAMSASSLEELAIGMSKVASAASTMGVTEDQLVATMSTIISVTRQAPESVGTALKTIYARMGDLQFGKTDEDGVELGQVSGTLQKLGVQVLDTNGEMRDMGTIMEETAAKWKTMSKAEQEAAAVALAGKRQYNNLFALFDNWDKYTNALNASTNSLGTLQEQQDTFMDSAEAHLQRMRTSAEGVYDSILDADSIKTFSDLGTGLLTVIEKLVDSMGGGIGVFALLGTIIPKVFNKQITQEVMNFANGLGNSEKEAAMLSARLEATQKFKNANISDQSLNGIIEIEEKLGSYYDIATKSQRDAVDAIAEQIATEAEGLELHEQKAKSIKEEIEGLKEQNEETKKHLDLLGKVNQIRTDKSYDANSSFSQPRGQMTQDVEATKKNLKIAQSDEYKNYLKVYDEARQKIDEINKGEKTRQEKLKQTQEELKKVADAYEQAYGKKLSGAESALSLRPGGQTKEESLDKTENSFNTVMQNAEEAKFGGLVDSFVNVENELEKLNEISSTVFGAVGLDADSATEKMKNAGEGIEQSLQSIENEFKDLDNTKTEALTKKIEEIRNIKITDSSTEADVERLGKLIEELGLDCEELRQKMMPTGQATERLGEANKKASTGVDLLNQSLEEEENAIEAAKAAIVGYKQNAQGIFDNLDFGKTIGDISNVASSISSLAMGISSFKSAIDTLANEDMSFGDKLIQVTMSFGMGIPMLINGLKGLGDAYKLLTIGQSSFINMMKSQGIVSGEIVTKEAIRLSLSKEQAIQYAKGTSLTKLYTAEQKKLLVEQLRLTSVTELDNILESENTKIKLKRTGASGILSAVLAGEMTITEGLSAAWTALNATMEANPIIFIVTAAILATAALYKLANVINDNILNSYKKFNKRIEENTKALDDYTQKIDEIKSKLEELKEQEESDSNNKNKINYLEQELELYEKLANKKKDLIAQDSLELANGDLQQISGLKKLDALKEGDFKEVFNAKDMILNTAFGPGAGIMSLFNIEEVDNESEKIKKVANEYKDLENEISSIQKRVSEKGATLGSEEKMNKLQNQLNSKASDLMAEIEVLEKTRDALENTDNPKKYAKEISNLNTQIQEYQNLLLGINNGESAGFSKTEQDINGIIAAIKTIDENSDLIPMLEKIRDFISFIQSHTITDIGFAIFSSTVKSLQEEFTKIEDKIKNSKVAEALKKIIDGFTKLKTTIENVDSEKLQEGLKPIKTIFDVINKNIKEFLELLKKIPGMKEAFDNAHSSNYQQEESKDDSKNSISDKRASLVNQDEKGNSIASMSFEASKTLSQSTDYLTYETLSASKEFNVLKNNIDEITKAFPALGYAASIAMDPLKAGTLEQEKAFEQLANDMAILQAAEEGVILTQEKATELGITSLDALEDARERNIISEKIYQGMIEGVGDAEAELYGYSAEALDEYSKEMKKNIIEQGNALESEEELQVAADKLALANMKLAKGLKSISSNWDKYNKYLDKAHDGTLEQAEAIGEIQKALAEGMNIDESLLSPEFIKNNKDVIQKASNGDSDAMHQLEDLTGDEVVKNITFNTDEAKQKALELSEDFKKINDVEVGAHLDDSEFIATINEMLRTGEMSVADMQAMFNAFGFNPQIDYKFVDMDASVASNLKLSGAIKDSQAAESYTKMKIRVPYINPAGTVKKASSMGAPASSSGGGGSSKKSKKEDNPLNADIDIYHRVNTQIEKLTKSIEKLQKQQSKLTGKALTENLKQQVDLNKKLIEQNKTKLDLQKKEYSALKSQLQTQGVAFNDDGTIANYDQALDEQQTKSTKALKTSKKAVKKAQKAVKKAKKAVKKNNSKANKQKLKNAQKKLTKKKNAAAKAQEDYDNFQTNLDRADELANANLDLESAIMDAEDNSASLVLTAYELSISLKMDTTDATRSWNDFIAESLKDLDGLNNGLNINIGKATISDAVAAYKNAQTYSADYANQLAGYQKAKEAYDKLTLNPEDVDDVYGNNAQAAFEAMQTYSEGMKAALEGANSEIERLKNSAKSLVSDIQEGYDYLGDKIDFINSSLEMSLSLNEKIYGEKQYKKRADILEKENRNNLSSIRLRRQEVTQLTNYAKEMRDKFGESSEEFKEAAAAAQEAEEKLNSITESAIDTIIQKYENAIDEIMDKALTKLLGNKSLDLIKEKWETFIYNQKHYLDGPETDYQNANYEYALKEALDSTDSEKNKKILQEIYDIDKARLEVMESQGRQTEIEYEFANRRLQLELKRIALEESLNNKTKMRLRRDSQGNYSYVYVGNDEDNDKKAKELRNDVFQYYEDVKNQYHEQGGNLINDVMENMGQQIAEGMKNRNYYADGQWTEEGQEYLNDLRNQFEKELVNGSENLNELQFSLLDSIRRLLEADGHSRSEISKLSDEDIINNYGQELLGKDSVITKLLDMRSSNGEKIKDVVEELFSGAISAMQEESKNIAEVNKESGNKITNPQIQSDVDGITDFSTAISKAGTAISSFVSSVNNSITTMKNILSNATADGSVMKNGNSTLVTNNSATTSTAISQTNAARENEATANANAVAEANLKEVYNKQEQVDPKLTNNIVEASDFPVTADDIPYYEGYDSKKKTFKSYKGTIPKNSQIKVKFIVDDAYEIENWGYIKKKDAKFVKDSYDTGGYTGEADDKGGFLAMLHRKELVLNAADTKNILNAVDIVRSLQNSTQLSLSKMLQTYENKASQLYSLNRNEQPQSLDQNVHIEANFPNVKDSKEIENALNNIVNVASQYAWR